MKVVHVVRQFHPSVGGLEDATLNLIQHLHETGRVEASVLTLDRIFTDPDRILPSEEEIRGIPVKRIPWRGSSRYPIAKSALAHVRNCDIIHVHAVDFFFDFLSATRFLHKKPLIATTQGGFFHTDFMAKAKKVWFRTITTVSAMGYDTVVACSENDFGSFAKVCPSNLRLIENGVDVDKFWMSSSPITTRSLIYFGRFAENKNIKALLHLLVELQRLHPRWTLIIAGSGNPEQQLQIYDEIKALELSGSVSVFPNVSVDELRALIGECSYYVCASYYEGFGIAAVEAISAGLIPILSDIPPFAKLIERTRGLGILFDPNDPTGAADQIEEAHLNIPGRWAGITGVRSSLGKVSRSYGWEEPAKQYLTLYEDVLERSPVPRSRAEALP